MDEIIVTRKTECPVFEADGFKVIGQTSPSRGSKEVATWRIEASPKAASRIHRLDREETFLVLEGSVEIESEGRSRTISRGDAAVVPAKVFFRLINSTDETAQLVACLPAGATAETSEGNAIGTPPWAV